MAIPVSGVIVFFLVVAAYVTLQKKLDPIVAFFHEITTSGGTGA